MIFDLLIIDESFIFIFLSSLDITKATGLDGLDNDFLNFLSVLLQKVLL